MDLVRQSSEDNEFVQDHPSGFIGSQVRVREAERDRCGISMPTLRLVGDV